MSGYFFTLRIGKFTIWLFKGFKGKFHDINHNKALVVGIVVSALMVFLIYVFVVKK